MSNFSLSFILTRYGFPQRYAKYHEFKLCLSSSKKKKKVQSQKPGWYLPCRAYAAIGTGIKQVNKYTNSNCDKC